MSSLNNVIVLNSDYSFLGFISWKRAFSLVMSNKVEILKISETKINSFSKTFEVPSVIRLIKMVRAIYKNEVPFSKKNVFARDSFICQYCNKKLTEKGFKNKPTIDHIIPISKGGLSIWTNCVCSCEICNRQKADKTIKEAKLRLNRQPWKPTINEFITIRMKNTGINKILEEFWNSFK